MRPLGSGNAICRDEIFNEARHDKYMKDADVRAAVVARLATQFAHDPTTRIVHEMGVWSGSVRVDIAVINGELTGVELKSDRDTLSRLPFQAQLYSQVFDRVSLVVGSRHFIKAIPLVPDWWEILRAEETPNGVRLVKVRRSKKNPRPDKLLVARLLWRDEALKALASLGLDKGWRSKSVDAIHERLATLLSYKALGVIVRSALKERTGWLGQ